MNGLFNSGRRSAILIVMAAVICFSAANAFAQATTDKPEASDGPPPLTFEKRTEIAPPAPERSRPSTSRWFSYAREVHTRLEKHLKSNAFDYGFELEVELWLDAEGRVTKAHLVGASGNAAKDKTVRQNFPPGLVLRPPEKDMPLPIKARIASDRRSGPT